MLAGASWLASFVIVIADSITKGLIPVFGFPYSDPGRTVYIVVLVSMQWGLVGLHAHQGTAYGRAGTLGFLMAYVGSTLALLGLGATWLFELGLLGQEPAVTLGLSVMVVGMTLLGVGFLLLGIATLQARVPPRWSGVALIVAFVAVAASIAFPASLGGYIVMLVLGFVWLSLGFFLWKRSRSATRAHEPGSREL